MAIRKALRSLFDYVDNGNLADFMDLSKVPEVPQAPLERYEPPRGRPANLDSILTPENAKRLEETAKRGADMGGLEWYNLEPLRMGFVERLGEDAGNSAFGRYVDYVAATSPRSTVASNIRRGSHFYMLDRNGMPVGGLTNADMPKGYGHIAHNTHDSKLREIEENGGLLPLKGPKVSSFAENLKGNQQPMTIDTHNFSAVRNDPKNKVSPSGTQYKYLEDFEGEIADKMGVTPAQMQASVWIAGDTGVADARPFMSVFDDVVSNTAERNGVSKSQALRDFIDGKSALYGLGGVSAVGGMTAPQDAEAAPVTGLIKNVPEFVNRFNRMVDQGYGGRNEIAVGEKLMHDPDLVNYDAMSDYALQHDGVPSGPFWKEQLAAYNDQIMEHGGLSNAAKQHWSRWYNNHLNRELGSKGREGRKDVKYSKPPPQPKNNAMALALAAAAGAGATGASAQDNGFPSWEEVSRDPTAPLPPPTWGESMGKAVDNLFHVLDMPATGLQGLARTGWGLLSGESFDTAASHGADVVRGGIDAGAERFGNYTLDKTGSPEAATLAHVLGIMASPI